jgi:hypothetical protein
MVHERRRDLQRTPTQFGAGFPAAREEATCVAHTAMSPLGRASGGHVVEAGRSLVARRLTVCRIVLACAGDVHYWYLEAHRRRTFSFPKE